MEAILGLIVRLLVDFVFFKVGRLFLQAVSFGRLYCPARYYRQPTQDQLSRMTYDEWALSGSFSWGLWRRQADGRVLVAAWLCELAGFTVLGLSAIIIFTAV